MTVWWWKHIGCPVVADCFQAGVCVCVCAHMLVLEYVLVCVCVCVYESGHWTNPNPFEEWKAQRMERQSENFTGAEGKLPWTLRCMKVQFVSHLFCFPSIRRKGALRPPRRKCPCEGLWVHRGSGRFNLPDQSFPFSLSVLLELWMLLPRSSLSFFSPPLSFS